MQAAPHLVNAVDHPSLDGALRTMRLGVMYRSRLVAVASRRNVRGFVH